jgi:glyoxylase-like metal-dependent hydrolase (beta-lactamase superfamily II)
MITLEINLLVVEVDGVRVLFDAGAGTAPELGRTMFGGGVGRAQQALARAEIDLASIDIVALSHAHPDHTWGLVAADGSACFPRAQVVIGRNELAHWMSAASVSTDALGQDRLIRDGARVSTGLPWSAHYRRRRRSFLVRGHGS